MMMAGTAHAHPTDSPWLDEKGTASLDKPPPSADDPGPRQWRFLAAAMLGMRGDQGGLLDSGYRIVGQMGLIMRPVSVALSIDHQLGDDNRLPGRASDPARFSEWVASARVGRAFPIGTDFWIQIAAGVARVNTRITRIATMNDAQRSSFGMDGVATFVWRSGLIASTLVFGVTAIPSDHEIIVDETTYVVPARIEPWFGLGVALML